ncbi:reverse transcriptase family protein [Vibrio astriarenae]
MKQKSKLKLDHRNKAYTYKDSPLFKLKSKKKLASLLHTTLNDLKPLRGDEGNYSVFEEIGKNGKPRKIQKPSRKLDLIHTRIASLLTRIKAPNYLHSGKKQHSNVTNASAHLDSSHLMATDIKSFFPSTSWKMIFSYFYTVMQCSGDVAEILADLCTCNKHLPTGSRISMPLAFWANSRMFNELNRLSIRHDVKMTVYVDDLTFSGDKVNRLFKSTVSKVVTKHGHVIHPVKTKLYSKNQAKLVTGVVVKGDKILVRNEQHLKLSQDLDMWKFIKDQPLALGLGITSRLIGRLHSMGTIEEKFKNKAKSVRQETCI